MEVALDFAIQCSPDHPWVAEHPEWFEHRADGSVRFAENPPFEYTDVCRVDFDTMDRVGLYTELYRVFMFWIARGVTIFRVDNPHTKPVVSGSGSSPRSRRRTPRSSCSPKPSPGPR